MNKEEKMPYFIENKERDTFTIYVKGTKPYIDLQKKIDKTMKYIEELLREEVEITDEDNVDYGMKCQRAYFSDSELIKVLELLGDKK